MRRIWREWFEKKTGKKKRREEVNYWQSYSDLMAAMLLVFVLIIAFTIYHAKEDYENVDGRLADRARTIARQEETIADLKEDLDKAGTILEELEAKQQETEKERQEMEAKIQDLEEEKVALGEEIEGLKTEMNKVIAIRRDIVEKLEEKFADSGIEASIDPETGTFRFNEGVFFDYDDSMLTEEGREVSDTFFPLYFSVILQNYENISEVIIEGHADDDGKYSYNMGLSQARALSVVNYCIGDEAGSGGGGMFSGEDLEKIREIVTANGRSYYGLVYDTDGNVDKDASRRVEIKFRVKGEDVSVLESE